MLEPSAVSTNKHDQDAKLRQLIITIRMPEYDWATMLSCQYFPYISSSDVSILLYTNYVK